MTATRVQTASFRGIKFRIASVETVFGRRNVVHEYPLRDIPYVEDLGKKAREFTINAYVIGDDYVNTLNRLISEIENNSEPGIFIHPSLGLMKVVAKEMRVNFRNNEGRIEYLTITFVEAGTNLYPSSDVDTQDNVDTVSANSITDSEESFESYYATAGFSDSLATRATNTLIGVSSAQGGDIISRENSLYGVMQDTISQGAYFSGATTQFSTFKNELEDFKTDVSTFVSSPALLSTRLTNIVASLASAFPNQPKKVIQAQKRLFNKFGLGIDDIPLTTPAITTATPNRIQMALNQDQIFDIVHINAFIQIVIAVSQMTFESRTDAFNLMSELQELIEPKLTYLADNQYDQAYKALNDARIAMVLDIKARSATLKTVKYVRNNDAIPALVLAYQQYQDAKQEPDIISRNHVRNPLFVQANTDIEILV